MRGTSWKAVAVVAGLVGAPVLAEDATARLPYGVPVPEGQELTAAPQPFDEKVHGQPIPNTQPEANEVLKGAAARLPERSSRPRPRDPIPDIFPGSGDRGFWVNQGQGIFAANDAQTDLVIPDNAIGTTIYAPTHMPAGNSCVETVTAHWRYTGMATTAHAHGFWDHCGFDGATGWQTFEGMDAAWKGKYVRVLDGEERYFTEAYKDGNGCAHGLLYNFTQGLWEEKLTPICGNSGFATGWTMWESHYLMDVAQRCPAFPRVRASGIQIYTVSAWPALGTGNSSQLGPYGLCWTNGTYNFSVAVPNSDWTALTP